MKMNFPTWLKNRDSQSPFERWLITLANRHKLRRYRDFINCIWHQAHKISYRGGYKNYPFRDKIIERFTKLFDEYELKH